MLLCVTKKLSNIDITGTGCWAYSFYQDKTKNTEPGDFVSYVHSGKGIVSAPIPIGKMHEVIPKELPAPDEPVWLVNNLCLGMSHGPYVTYSPAKATLVYDQDSHAFRDPKTFVLLSPARISTILRKITGLAIFVTHVSLFLNLTASKEKMAFFQEMLKNTPNIVSVTVDEAIDEQKNDFNSIAIKIPSPAYKWIVRGNKVEYPTQSHPEVIKDARELKKLKQAQYKKALADMEFSWNSAAYVKVT